MNDGDLAKTFSHALANKLLPLHGRIGLLKMQTKKIEPEELDNLERITESMIALNSDFRNELESLTGNRMFLESSKQSSSTDSLYELTYSSESCLDSNMVNKALIEIAETSHASNRSLGISGYLLYRNGFFMQRLEGSNTAIQRLFGKICLDERHKNICLLSNFPISSRHFSDWQMLKSVHLQDKCEAARMFDHFKEKNWAKLSQSQSLVFSQEVCCL